MKRKIPHIKVGGKLLFKKEELERWLDGHRQKTVEQLKSLVTEKLTCDETRK